jgi:hypothetical protein
MIELSTVRAVEHSRVRMFAALLKQPKVVVASGGKQEQPVHARSVAVLMSPVLLLRLLCYCQTSALVHSAAIA